MNLSLKNVPHDVYRQLKQSAKKNRRSMNSEIIARLEEALGSEPEHIDELLARIRKVRPSLRSGPAKAQDIRRFIDEGRP